MKVSLTSEQAGQTALAVAEAKGCHQVVALLKVNTPCLLRLLLLNADVFCFLRRRDACKYVSPFMTFWGNVVLEFCHILLV